MSDRYIIKNCECKVKGKTTLCVRDIPYKKCENITDCKLKQIVELCRERSDKCKRCKTFEDYQSTDCLHCSNDDVIFANDILKLLDIEEVE